MSEKTARSYIQQSNREKPRTAAEKKVVFKPVLDNPFHIRWPSVPINLQNAVLAYLLTLLEGSAVYHRAQCKESRKRKKQEAVPPRKRGKLGGSTTDEHDEDTEENQPLPESTSAVSASKPIILSHAVLGINAVTKRLEYQARQVRRTTVIPIGEDQDLKSLPPLACVFVCRAEINPPILIEHLPPLVAACNSVSGKQFVKLVPLPQDSEQKLADSLGIRSASMIAVDVQFPGLPALAERLESVPLLTASWLTPATPSAHLVPTHIKHLRTSAPKDMKATKQKRLREKLAAKEKQKEKRQLLVVK